MGWFTDAGLALQLAGVIVAGYGAWRTWYAFAPQGEGFFDVITKPTRAGWDRLTAFAIGVYRRIRGRRPQTIVGAGAAMGVGMAMNARARVQFRTLPGDVDPAEAVKELDDRTRRLMTIVSDNKESAEDDFARVDKEIGTVGTRLSEVADHLEGQTRRVAVGGIRLEAVGLFLVAGGTLLQWLGAHA